MSIQSVAITGVWFPSSYADPLEAALRETFDAIETPKPLELGLTDVFEFDADCQDCPHRMHDGECVDGTLTVCGCDNPSLPAYEESCCDQASCPTSSAYDPAYDL